jgi:uncharacterized membrane protein
MSEYVLARVIHVLSVVLWIGGVAMVTTVPTSATTVAATMSTVPAATIVC